MRAGTGGMIVLQEQADIPQQHFAFTVSAADIDAAATELRRRGIVADGPVVHEWIPARSLYFRGSRRPRCGTLRTIATPRA